MPNAAPSHGVKLFKNKPNLRLSARQRGYTTAWDKARARFLEEHPWCVECAKLDVRKKASDVDHVEPHKGNMRKFWNRNNWQSLCSQHHKSKTGRGL